MFRIFSFIALLLVMQIGLAKEYVPFVKVKEVVPGVLDDYDKSVLVYIDWSCKFSQEYGKKIDAWATSLPSEAGLIWVPVVDGSNKSKVTASLLYFAILEKYGATSAGIIRNQLFEYFIDKKRKRLDITDAYLLAVENNLDGKLIVEAMGSKKVGASLAESVELTVGVGLSSVPTVVIGQYATTPDLFPPENKELFTSVMSGLLSGVIE